MFTLNQTGLAAGTFDRSRTDGLQNGAVVTITYSGTGTFRPRLLWVPPGDINAVPSLVELVPGEWGFSPTPNKPGSYRIQGIENEGRPSERRVERIFGVRTAAGVLIPAYGESSNQLANIANATATHVTQSANNATDFLDATLNNLAWAGWWRAWHELALVAGSVPPGTAATWLSDSTPPTNWGTPTNVAVPTVDFAPSLGSGTLTLHLAAHRRLDHPEVECVLLGLPAEVSGGRALPTTEQADGVTLTTGQRCLTTALSGATIGILRHDGTKLVVADDNSTVATGQRIYVRSGRIFKRKTFRYRGAFGGSESWMPLWQVQSGPTWANQKTVAAAGSAEWVLLLSCPLGWGELGAVHDVSLRADRWSGSSYTDMRVFRAECTYVGNGITAVPATGMTPITLHEPGETDEVSRLKADVTDGVLSVWGYRDAAGGSAWSYRVEVSAVLDRNSEF